MGVSVSVSVWRYRWNSILHTFAYFCILLHTLAYFCILLHTFAYFCILCIPCIPIQKCFENDSKVFVSLSVLKLFVRIEIIAATRALGGLVIPEMIFGLKNKLN